MTRRNRPRRFSVELLVTCMLLPIAAGSAAQGGPLAQDVEVSTAPLSYRWVRLPFHAPDTDGPHTVAILQPPAHGRIEFPFGPSAGGPGAFKNAGMEYILRLARSPLRR